MTDPFCDPVMVRALYADSDRIGCRGAFLQRYANRKESFRSMMIRLLPPRSYRSVLDIGCGDGSFMARLHSVWPRSRLHGLDVAPNPRCEALGFLDYRIYDGRRVPPYRRHFDLIVCMHMLYHVPGLGPFLRQVELLLSPRGVALVTTKSKYTLPRLEAIFRAIVERMDLRRRINIPRDRPESRFCLENGAPILRQAFPLTRYSIRQEVIATQLIVDDIADLRRYVRSSPHYDLGGRIGNASLARKYLRLWRDALTVHRPFLDIILEGVFVVERRR